MGLRGGVEGWGEGGVMMTSLLCSVKAPSGMQEAWQITYGQKINQSRDSEAYH